MSSKARKRHEKNMDRAEAIMDRTANKVQRSKGSYKVIQTRKKTWEEINRDVVGVEPPAKKRKKGPDTQVEDDAVAAFYADDDEEMDEADEIVESGAAQAIPVPLAPPSDEEEIL